MDPDSKTFLAATVLNDGQIVSYRSLSRELKVHSNVAKKMLYEFHRVQNSRKSGSVYATYLLDGVPKDIEPSVNGLLKVGDDVHMQSSPYMSSSMPQESNEEDAVPSRRIMLAREEDLGAARARFEQIHSIHIYSLGPSPVQNLQVLSECNRAISAKHNGEDPLVVGTQYGVIHNNGVKVGSLSVKIELSNRFALKRRTAKRPVIQPPAAPSVKSKEKPSTNSQETPKGTQESKSSDRLSSSGKPGTSISQAESKSTDQKPTSKPKTLKRETSDIFKSFSKPKAKANREDTGSSAGASPAPTNVQSDINSNQADEPMRDASEDEDEDNFVGTNKSEAQPRKSRSEREEQLRKLMDEEEDEEMQDTAEQHAQPSQGSEPVDTSISQKASSPEPSVVTTGGRRRGRRKVMRKKTIKDDEGYLVTKEEPTWESFSEDEPAPQKERTPVATASSNIAKGKKSSGKPGQGNIRSFFGKK